MRILSQGILTLTDGGDQAISGAITFKDLTKNVMTAASRGIFEQAAGRSDHYRLSSAGRVALSKLSDTP